jgi:hypothetical protein
MLSSIILVCSLRELESLAIEVPCGSLGWANTTIPPAFRITGGVLKKQGIFWNIAFYEVFVEGFLAVFHYALFYQVVCDVWSAQCSIYAVLDVFEIGFCQV